VVSESGIWRLNETLSESSYDLFYVEVVTLSENRTEIWMNENDLLLDL